MAKLSIPGSGEGRRIALWIAWTLQMLISLIYIALTFATSSRLTKSVAELKDEILGSYHPSAWRAPIAAAVLGGLLVLFFNIMSCVILIRKSVNKSGPGFGFGFIMAWSFVMSFFTFLCGLVLDSFTDEVEKELEANTNGKWQSYWTGAYKGTVALAFICCAMYMLFFLALVIFQGGISKTIGMYDAKSDEKRKMEMAAMARLQNSSNPLSSSAQI